MIITIMIVIVTVIVIVIVIVIVTVIFQHETVTKSKHIPTSLRVPKATVSGMPLDL